MPFTLTWAGLIGTEKLVVPTAEAAVRDHVLRSRTVENLTVKDDEGKTVTIDQLMALVERTPPKTYDA